MANKPNHYSPQKARADSLHIVSLARVCGVRHILRNTVLIAVLFICAFTCAQDENTGEVIIADYRLPPVMVYTKAKQPFTKRLKNDLKEDLAAYPDECVDGSVYWHCDNIKIENSDGYRGLNGDGKPLEIGFLCDSSNTPQQKYYSEEFLIEYDCVKIWYPVPNTAYVTYPTDYEE